MADTPAVQPTEPQKPLRAAKWLIAAAAVVIIFSVMFGLVNTIRFSRQPQTGEKPRVTDPSAVSGFDETNKHQTKNLSVPPPEEPPSVTPPTTEQSKALAIGGGQSDAQRKYEERQAAKLAALKSSSVLVDFSDEGEKGDQFVASKTRQFTGSFPAKQPGAAENEEEEPAAPKEKNNIAPWATYTGKLYRLLEGRDIIEAILMNRINGSAAGQLMAQVSLDIYSHNHQKLLIQQGTILTGDVTAVNSIQQQRLFVAFHRMIMPDGFSVSLDKFAGLDQTGEVGLRDLVNHHYLSIFGASLAIGAIGGVAQIGNTSSGFGYDPGVQFRNGISQQTGQEAMQVLNRFLNQLPTFTVRERARMRIWLTNDLLLPAADNHTMPGDL